MKIEHSSINNIPTIMSIIKDAQTYLANLNIDQWQDGYPDENQIKLDIENNDSYVILNDENKIIGTTVFTTKNESTYNAIDGKWITNEDAIYGVIHRLAVGEEYRKSGFSNFVFNYCENELIKNGVKSMRIDTHKDNKGMQSLLLKRGYQYCGIIILSSGGERLAYEKILINSIIDTTNFSCGINREENDCGDASEY